MLGPMRPKGKQMSKLGDARIRFAEKLRKEYDAGTSIRDLGVKYGYSYGGMHALLTLAGTKFRARGWVKGSAAAKKAAAKGHATRKAQPEKTPAKSSSDNWKTGKAAYSGGGRA